MAIIKQKTYSQDLFSVEVVVENTKTGETDNYVVAINDTPEDDSKLEDIELLIRKNEEQNGNN